MYSIDEKERTILAQGWGVLTFSDLLSARVRLAADPVFDSRLPVLADLRDVERFELDSIEMQSFAELRSMQHTSRWALVVADNAAFGFARMFQVYREMAGESVVRIFNDREKATAWIAEGSAPPTGRILGDPVNTSRRFDKG
jgi:hypothetical protein